jgi:hypothetical protein
MTGDATTAARVSLSRRLLTTSTMRSSVKRLSPSVGARKEGAMPIPRSFHERAHEHISSRSRFQEVGAEYTRPAVKSAADHALRACVADLGLPSDARIRWFIPEGESSRKTREWYGDAATPWVTFEAEETLTGKVEPATHAELWIRADQSPEDVVDTVAHEARHSWQLMRYFGGSRTFALPRGSVAPHVEEDADEYAAWYVRRPPDRQSHLDAARAGPTAHSVRLEWSVCTSSSRPRDARDRHVPLEPVGRQPLQRG